MSKGKQHSPDFNALEVLEREQTVVELASQHVRRRATVGESRPQDGAEVP